MVLVRTQLTIHEEMPFRRGAEVCRAWLDNTDGMMPNIVDIRDQAAYKGVWALEDELWQNMFTLCILPFCVIQSAMGASIPPFQNVGASGVDAELFPRRVRVPLNGPGEGYDIAEPNAASNFERVINQRPRIPCLNHHRRGLRTAHAPPDHNGFKHQK